VRSRAEAARGITPALLLALVLTSCGYKVAGKSDLLPDTIHTIAIPAFANATIQYKLTDLMPQAVAREFITRTRYRVVDDAERADAVLRGTILGFAFYPTIFDDERQRANVAEMRVNLQLTLVERATGKVLFEKPNMEVSEVYQISPDAAKYFEESEPALRRASERVSRQIVTWVLQNF
jgi:hypothetical protein